MATGESPGGPAETGRQYRRRSWYHRCMQFKTAIPYVVTGLSIVGDLGALLTGVNVPQWVHLIVAGCAAASVRLAHLAPPPDVLVPTPVNGNDGDGPAAGKASGEAAQAASRGPFVKS